MDDCFIEQVGREGIDVVYFVFLCMLSMATGKLERVVDFCLVSYFPLCMKVVSE